MKWLLRLLGLGLVGGMLIYFLTVYPFVIPLLVHHPQGWPRLLFTKFLAVNATSGAGPHPIIVLVMIAAMLVVASCYLAVLDHTTNHGSAGFMGWREVGRFSAPLLLKARSVMHLLSGTATVAPSHFVIGQALGHTIYLNEEQQREHVLMVAPTGGGKSAYMIIPNLLCEQGQRSVFVADVMDELYGIGAATLARHQQVWRFAPTDPEESMGYNPLAYVQDAREAAQLAECWVENTGKSKEPYWDQCAIFLISAVVMHLRHVEPVAPFARLGSLIAQTPYAQLEHLLGNSPAESARQLAQPFLEYLSKNERLVGSVMTTIINRLQVLSSTEVQAVTTTNEIDFRHMVEVPTALFLCVPPDETTFHRPLLACFTMQMVREWRKEARKHASKRLPRQIACYLDEFANLGAIPDFPAFISTARHYDICLFLAIQNFSQLSARYGQEGMETILNNAKTHLVFPGAGLRETKYYSERLGQTTVQSSTHHIGGAGNGAQESWTQGETGRLLMTPDEIRTMPLRHVLMVPAAFKALVVKAKPYYEHRRLARLAKLPFHLQWRRIQPEPSESALSVASVQAAKQTPSKGTLTLQRPVPPLSEREDDEQHFLHK